ncbi:MAG: 4Fe-4S dicluster domain-containing protein [Dehalococcoidia bacterium]|nr:4Fe-4S dicluster domain-containing protein [Dehalococcoidia bacterium]
MRYGMVIDLQRCIGCYGCQVACKAENATPPGILWGRLKKGESGKFPNVRRINLPLLCMHCKDPECLKVCPSGATQQREDGIVFVDADVCVGCRACMVACPYTARYYHDAEKYYFGDQGPTPFEEVGYKQHPVGVVSKCDFCRHRVDEGLEPACVANCMAKGRFFGDLDDPYSEVSRLISEKRGSQLYPELGTDPSVYYLPP